MQTNVGTCRTDEVGSGTNKSAQEWLGEIEKLPLTLPPPGDQTQGLRI